MKFRVHLKGETIDCHAMEIVIEHNEHVLILHTEKEMIWVRPREVRIEVV